MDQNVSNAVCYIEKELKDGTAACANGVFVSPRHVLTSMHCVQGARTGRLLFQNSQGESSLYQARDDGGRIVTDRKHDLAVVTLERQIGRSIAFPAEAGNKALQGLLRVFTRYQNRAGVFNALAVAGKELVETNSAQEFHLFATDYKVGPGYSGSPVVNAEGAIVGILSGTVSSPRLDYDLMFQAFKRLKGLPHHFTASPPGAVHKIVTQALGDQPVIQPQAVNDSGYKAHDRHEWPAFLRRIFR